MIAIEAKNLLLGRTCGNCDHGYNHKCFKPGPGKDFGGNYIDYERVKDRVVKECPVKNTCFLWHER